MSPNESFNYLRNILLAPVYDVARETDITPLDKISQRLGVKVLLKREDQQPVHSFKLRGSYNKLIHLSAEQKQKGVIAASAGNHAQGLALAAKKLGVDATIVMPITTPEIKIDNVRRLGADVRLLGKSFDEAQSACLKLAGVENKTIIHPFNSPEVIAGQGTVAVELLRQIPHPDVVFIPCGGGGLLAGMAVYLKQMCPEIKVIAVEADDSACLQAAMDAGHPVDLESVGLFADGVAVKRIGDETFRLIRQYCDQVIVVSSDEICTSIKDIFEETRVIAEPAGALSLAGLQKYCHENEVTDNQQMVAILSGANMNFHNLRYVSERCELGEQKEAILAVTIPEEKGSFKRFCEALGGRVITEFNYRYNGENTANIFVGIRLTGGAQESRQLLAELSSNQYKVEDFSDNELAKLHIRHMVGGTGQAGVNERIFRFQSPEYPGALQEFLNTLGSLFNITLFHYRNHGAAFGQVLAGFEVEKDQELAFFRHFKALGYEWTEETNNPAYRSFLQGGNTQA